jgi:hypothetical protein
MKFTSKIVLLFIVGVPTVYFVWFFIINEMELSIDPSYWGTFGDFFGGILNPIIAFCAFFWLAKSIRIQKQELEETRETLKESGKTQKKQRFEDTYFSLLEQHNIALSNLLSNVSDEANITIGNITSKKQRKPIEDVKKKIFAHNINELRESKKILLENNQLYGHYFRILYQVLKFIATDCPYSKVGKSFNSEDIKNESVSPEEKTYSNIVRAFLNEDISQILAINCYCESKEDSFYKFKLLIERYSFLEHMPFYLEGKMSVLLNETVNIYSASAFGDNLFYTNNLRKN